MKGSPEENLEICISPSIEIYIQVYIEDNYKNNIFPNARINVWIKLHGQKISLKASIEIYKKLNKKIIV